MVFEVVGEELVRGVVLERPAMGKQVGWAGGNLTAAGSVWAHTMRGVVMERPAMGRQVRRGAFSP